MIYDEGDYFGRTVNIAARIASQASENHVFVGGDALRHVEPQGFTLREVGQFDLKGIAQPLTLYEAVRDRSTKTARPCERSRGFESHPRRF
jgi:adenylate cyclase